MGNIYVRKGKKTGSLGISYMFQGKQIRKIIGPQNERNKKLAKIILGKIEAQIKEGKHLDIQKNEKIKFEEMAKTYLEAHSKLNKRSFRRDETIIKNLLPFFGGRWLFEITSLDVENYKRKRKEQVATATVNREFACLRHIFTKAIEWDKLRENPAAKVKLFRIDNKRLRYLEREEMKKLIDACSEHLKPIIIVALFTGMRKSEILNLKWRDLDFSQKIIYLLDTKNGEKREVYMNDIVYSVLLGVKKHPDSGYVFCNKEGKPYGNVRRSFATALRKTGIKDFKFHDLRHTFASQLTMAGIDLKTVQELLGHKTLDMTLRYAHLSPDHKRVKVDYFCNQFMDSVESKISTISAQKDILQKLPKEPVLDKIDVASIFEEPAHVAQLVEQSIRNAKIAGSNPAVGS